MLTTRCGVCFSSHILSIASAPFWRKLGYTGIYPSLKALRTSPSRTIYTTCRATGTVFREAQLIDLRRLLSGSLASRSCVVVWRVCGIVLPRAWQERAAPRCVRTVYRPRQQNFKSVVSASTLTSVQGGEAPIG